jgi:hypothetical protein
MFERTCFKIFKHRIIQAFIHWFFRVQNYDSIFTIPIILAKKDSKGRIIFRNLVLILKDYW